ncbi:SatD family protein [Methanolacinia paynteri]|uniref:SatD family protein n=1 Tax=Methanolacinia paynteri TaxID=230356 RepID=UPI00064FC1FB|nr:SatD family protein [Methanolacinia paynteri]
MSEKIYAVLTGDLVNYSRLEGNERTEYVIHLWNVLQELEADNINFEIFRGDSFQAVLPSSREALEIALRIRSYILSQDLHSNKKIKPDVRIAIGVGGIENYDKDKNIGSCDGEAFRNSGPELDRMDKKKQKLTIKTGWNQLNRELKVECSLLEAITARWTKPQAEIIYHTLLGKKQSDVAELLEISQSNVSARLNSANFDAVEMMIRRYQEIVDEERINNILFGHVSSDIGSTLKCLVDRHPDSPVFHREYGDYLFEKGSHKEASEEYYKALEKDPENQRTEINLIASLFHEGKLSSVEKECKKLLKNDNNNVPALFYLGEIYKRRKDFSKAEEFYREAWKHAENEDFNPINGLIYSLLLQEKFDRAEKEMEEFLKLHPSEHSVVENMYNYLKEKGDIERANEYVEKVIEELKEIKKDSEDDNNLLYNLAYLNYLILKYPEAEIHLSKIIETDPSNPDAHRFLSVVYNDKGELNKAEREIEIAINLQPEYFRNYYLKGHILQKMKRHKEAKKAFETVIRLEPADAIAYLALGVSEYALGKREKANEHFIKAHELDNSLSSGKEMLSFLDSGSFKEEDL